MHRLWAVAVVVLLAGCVGGGKTISVGGAEIPIYPGMEEQSSFLGGLISLGMEEGEVEVKIYTTGGDKVDEIADWYAEELASRGFAKKEGEMSFDFGALQQGDGKLKMLYYLNEEKNVGVVITLAYSPDDDTTYAYIVVGSGEVIEKESQEQYESPTEAYDNTYTSPEEQVGNEDEQVNIPNNVPFDVYPNARALSYIKSDAMGSTFYEVRLESTDNFDDIVNWYKNEMSRKGEVMDVYSEDGTQRTANLVITEPVEYSIYIAESPYAEGVVEITIFYRAQQGG